MSRTANEELKAIALVSAKSTIATVTGGANDVEIYEEDAIVVANVNNADTLSNSFVTVTVTGSLVATPTVYDQTLATFTATAVGAASGIGAQRIKLSGIKNIKGVATLSATSLTVIAIIALVRPNVKASGTNSATLA